MNNHYVLAVRPTYEPPDRSGIRNWTSRQDSGKVYSVLPAVSKEVSTPTEPQEKVPDIGLYQLFGDKDDIDNEAPENW